MDFKKAIITAVAVGIISPIVSDIHDRIQYKYGPVVNSMVFVAGAMTAIVRYMPNPGVQMYTDFYEYILLYS